MTQSPIPKILELATPVAEDLGLELVGAVFQTNQRPPVLRVDIRNPDGDTSLDNCEAMSRALEAALDASEVIPDAYVLEISSPGLSDTLTSDRDFVAFKGFSVTVTTTEPYKGHTQWNGQLVRRDDTSVQLSCKGRIVSVPRESIVEVRLD
ncbi:ribosome maturation factor RimP [Baaleninema sp.]|uniref:ribosome maturation factor RimP n=1 Tax=Baaleninema sp. TaxID=3101197 RepID=UPI003D05E480